MRNRDITTGRYSDNGVVPPDELREKLEKLAMRLAGHALGEDDPFDATTPPITGEIISIFKATSNYYTATRRLPVAKPDEEDEDGFAALKERINGAGVDDEA